MSSDQDDNHYAIRVGSLVLYNIGQLLPHQINSEKFHTRDFIYPVSGICSIFDLFSIKLFY